MAAYKLERVQENGEPIRLTRTEATTLTSFRRSAYFEPIISILGKILEDSRIKNETEEASEANRQEVLAARNLLDRLKNGKVVLK